MEGQLSGFLTSPDWEDADVSEMQFSILAECQIIGNEFDIKKGTNAARLSIGFHTLRNRLCKVHDCFYIFFKL